MANEGTFEEAMKRLEEIVKTLESPGLPLEEGMRLYREGELCSRLCREKLAQARHELELWQNEESVSAEEFENLQGVLNGKANALEDE